MITRQMLMDKSQQGDAIYKHWLDVWPPVRSIRSPFREDKKPSFSFKKGKSGEYYWTDWATKESGGSLDFAAKKYGFAMPAQMPQVMAKVWTEILGLPLPEKEKDMDKKYFTNEQVLETLGHENILKDHLERFAPKEQVVAALQLYNIGSTGQSKVRFWHTDKQGRHCAYKHVPYRERNGSITKKPADGSPPKIFYKYATEQERERPSIPLFGAQLVPKHPDRTIVIFEAEDGAVMAHLLLGGELIYTACGGPLAAQKLEGFEGRTVLFAPDLDVLNSPEQMKQLKATLERIRSLKVKIEVWPIMQQLAPEVRSHFSPEAFEKLDIRDYLEARQALTSAQGVSD